MEKREEKEMLTLAPGQINLLALNAGVGSRASFNDAEPDAAELRRILDTNVFGVLNGITTLLPVIKQHQQQQESSNTATTKSSPGEAEAAIVITGSKQGITNPPGSSPAYNASKAAVKTLAEQLEHSLRDFPGDGKKRGIAVHLLVPGWTWTPLAGQGWLAKEKPPGAWTPGQVVDYLEARMREGQFWVLCPDNDVDEETDRKRMLVSFLPPSPSPYLSLVARTLSVERSEECDVHFNRPKADARTPRLTVDRRRRRERPAAAQSVER